MARTEKLRSFRLLHGIFDVLVRELKYSFIFVLVFTLVKLEHFFSQFLAAQHFSVREENSLSGPNLNSNRVITLICFRWVHVRNIFVIVIIVALQDFVTVVRDACEQVADVIAAEELVVTENAFRSALLICNLRFKICSACGNGLGGILQGLSY